MTLRDAWIATAAGAAASAPLEVLRRARARLRNSPCLRAGAVSWEDLRRIAPTIVNAVGPP